MRPPRVARAALRSRSAAAALEARRAALAGHSGTAPRPRQSVRVPRVVDVESRCSLALRALVSSRLHRLSLTIISRRRATTLLFSGCLVFSQLFLPGPCLFFGLWLTDACVRFFWCGRAKKVLLPDGSRRRLGPGCPVIARAESAFYLFTGRPR